MTRKYILQLESNVELAILNIEETTESRAVSQEELLSALHERMALLMLMGGKEKLVVRTVKTLNGQVVAQLVYKNGQLVELSVCPAVLETCKSAVEQMDGNIRRAPFFNPIAHDKSLLEALSDLAERFHCEDVYPQVTGGTSPVTPLASLVWRQDVLESAVARGLLITHFLERNLHTISGQLIGATRRLCFSPKVIPLPASATL